MQLLGSIIYVTSAFYGFVFRGVNLVHWTHSFCVFIITWGCDFFKMGYSIRNDGKYQSK